MEAPANLGADYLIGRHLLPRHRPLAPFHFRFMIYDSKASIYDADTSPVDQDNILKKEALSSCKGHFLSLVGLQVLVLSFLAKRDQPNSIFFLEVNYLNYAALSLNAIHMKLVSSLC